MHCRLLILFLALLVSGCDPQVRKALETERGKNEKYFAGLREAQPSAPFVKQFSALFPTAQITYRYFGTSKCPGFDANITLHGRYVLAMQLPVQFDDAGRKVTGYGDPQFYLLEMTKVDKTDGVVSISYGPQRVFGSKEWKKLVESNGDFNTIGWTMITDRPFPGAEGYKPVQEE
jgi:hypothetical protein